MKENNMADTVVEVPVNLLEKAIKEVGLYNLLESVSVNDLVKLPEQIFFIIFEAIDENDSVQARIMDELRNCLYKTNKIMLTTRRRIEE
jgi:hypothetical protein